jgi:hypothetical protein
MADRVPLPVVAGMLGGFIGIDQRIMTLSSSGRLDAMLIGIRSAGSTDVTVEVRSGVVVLATATITAGANNTQVQLDPPLELVLGAQLDMRVTAGGTDAVTLSGWVELLYYDDEAFTTLDRVKRSLDIVDTESDELILQLISSVTTRMRRYMGRYISVLAVVLERYGSTGRTSRLQLNEWPIISVSEVDVSGTAVTEYDISEKVGHLINGEPGSPVPWARGDRHIQVSYISGYAPIPDDIEQAATVQVIWDFNRSGRQGQRTSVVDEANVVTYLVDAWAPDTVQVMDNYRSVWVA